MNGPRNGAQTPLAPYGDTLGDGRVQLSFTLPLEWSEAADEAARRLVAAMGFGEVAVAEGRRIASGFSFFVVYASTPVTLDPASVALPRVRSKLRTIAEVDAFVLERFGRPIRVAGACIGTDAHTVGIDAILNMKGYRGDYGLERYHAFESHNLGSQVSVEDLAHYAREHDVDALLASQVVTQKGSDVANFTALVELLEAEELRERLILVAGGPRMTSLLAAELGYDAGFGRGTLPSEVANFIAERIVARSERAPSA
ncbi:MAG: OAM dimerization domain-containing protein [Vulcanimicrobiaceae bacterium]